LQRRGLPGHAGRAPDQLGVRGSEENLALERVREVRDEIKESVEQLVRELDAEATAA
jgi:hypothetical protein